MKYFEGVCPYCGGNDIEALDSFEDSEKMICRECGEDFIHWYEDNSVTDRHNRDIEAADVAAEQSEADLPAAISGVSGTETLRKAIEDHPDWAAIRTGSEMDNEWMDAFVFVPPTFCEAAADECVEAMNYYWEEGGGNGMAYGDCIKERLSGLCEYAIVYCDYDPETDELTDAWNAEADALHDLKKVVYEAYASGKRPVICQGSKRSSYPDSGTVRRIRERYPVGCRVELVRMGADPYSTLKPGDQGVVRAVDDIGTVFVNWDCGSGLGVVYGADVIRKILQQN